MSKASSQIFTPTQVIKPEDITIDDLKYLSQDNFALWALTSGVTVDNNNLEFNNHRYLVPIYCDNSKEIVWQKAAQMGATVYMMLRIIWWLKMHPGRNAGLYMPNSDLVENTSKDRLTPLLNSIQDIAPLLSPTDKLTLRKIGTSSFYLFHLGGVSSKDSVPLDYVSFDEVRLCSDDDIEQAMVRIDHSPYKYKVLMSTCGIPGTDINMRFNYGTQHVWHSRCFTGNTRIWVKEKITNKIKLMSFYELKDSWKDYKALSCRTKHKVLVWRDITAFHDNGTQKIIKLKFKNGSDVECTPDHKLAWVSTKEVSTISYIEATNVFEKAKYGVYDRNNILTASKIYSDETYKAPYDLMTLAMVGAYLAEGSWKTKSIINIAQLRNKHLHTLAIEWAKLQDLHYNDTDEGVDISLHNRPDLFELFQSCGKGCENKKIPDSLRGIGSTQASYILDSYISGDGCRRYIDKNIRHNYRGLNLLLDTYWNIVTTSEQLKIDLQELAFKAGFYTSSRENKIKEGRKPTWSVFYNPKAVAIKSVVSDHFNTSYISNIETIENEQPVFDITVDAAENRDHNYVLENGTVVHNCGCSDGVDLARAFPDCVVYDDPRRKGEVYLRCPKCKWEIKDSQNGRYVPHNPGAAFNSYHVSQLVSKFTTPALVWRAFKEGKNKSEFFNAKLGLPYIDEANRGVTMDQLLASVDPYLEWAKPNKKENQTAMGVDQGAGYLVVTIADTRDSKKRIRHVEIIEQQNPDYKVNGKVVSPFVRLGELMQEYNVRLCVCDAMPNVNEALQFATRFPGRVFLAYYQKEAKDMVQWGDKKKYKETIRKAGPLLKFKYMCVLSRFSSMDFALGEWANGNVVCPDPDKLRQMAFDEKIDMLLPEAPAHRMFRHLVSLIKQFNETNEDTGEGKWEWIHTGPDHLAHAWSYCNVALERMRKGVLYTFA